MKKLSIIYGLILFLSLLSSYSFAVTYFNYHTDFLEPGNSGGWTYSHKTFDAERTVPVGKTAEIDIWVHDILLVHIGSGHDNQVIFLIIVL
jgi:hypothetical protein